MPKTDLNEIKAVIPAVKKMIRHTLKLDAGNQNALDIIAVSRGYSGYHMVKAISNLPYYELRANMGTREKPFNITLEVGHWLEKGDAEIESKNVLIGCQQFQTWFLYCEGENTHIKFETTPEPEKGFVYQIEVTGHTLADIEDGLDEIARRVDNVEGFDRNETGSFSFRRVGEEYDESIELLEDIEIEFHDDFVLMDDQGNILKGSDSEDVIDEILDQGETPGHPWSNKVLIR